MHCHSFSRVSLSPQHECPDLSSIITTLRSGEFPAGHSKVSCVPQCITTYESIISVILGYMYLVKFLLQYFIFFHKFYLPLFVSTLYHTKRSYETSLFTNTSFIREKKTIPCFCNFIYSCTVSVVKLVYNL